MNKYSRADILRILHITAKQLAGWQRAGLVPVSDTFTFFDLLQLTKVRDLAAKRVRPAAIRKSLQDMQKQVADMENPLLEAGAFSVGSRIAFRHQGHSVEPIAGSFLMDFSPAGTVADFAEPGTPDFTVTFDSGLSQEQVTSTLEALADYYRACGGVGFEIDFEFEDYAREQALKSA